MISIITLLGFLYLAMLATVYWHEIGHCGKRIKIDRWFPWVQGRSEEVRYQYGGLVANFIALYAIWHFRPENTLILLFGFFNWVHFILYTIFGSFNHEINWPVHMWDKVVFDDVPNRLFWLFVPLGLITFWIFKDFYFQVIIDAFALVV